MPAHSPVRGRPRTRTVAGLGALCAASLLATGPAFAGAAVLTTSAGPVAVGDTLVSTLYPGTTATLMFSLTRYISCTAAQAQLKVVTNPASPGAADVDVTALAFADCTFVGGTGYTITSITESGTGTAVFSDGSPLELSLTAVTEAVVLSSTLGSLTCDYGNTTSEAAIVGVIANPGAGGSITYTAQPVHLLSGSSVCGSSAATIPFSATFGTPLDATAPVTVN